VTGHKTGKVLGALAMNVKCCGAGYLGTRDSGVGLGRGRW